MTVKSTRRLIREGGFDAEVDVHLIEEEGGWSPYLSLEDPDKLDAVRDALRAGDLQRGAQLATQEHRSDGRDETLPSRREIERRERKSPCYAPRHQHRATGPLRPVAKFGHRAAGGELTGSLLDGREVASLGVPFECGSHRGPGPPLLDLTP